MRPYLVDTPFLYFPPWPSPPNAPFTFSFAPGTSASQILNGQSHAASRVILVAGDADFVRANTKSIFYALGNSPSALSGAMELPPGTSESLNVQNTNDLWIVAQNATDIISGRVEP